MRIRVGAFTDIAVMDLDTVQDHTRFDQPHEYASAVQHVLVNGEMTGERPGTPLRSR